MCDVRPLQRFVTSRAAGWGKGIAAVLVLLLAVDRVAAQETASRGDSIYAAIRNAVANGEVTKSKMLGFSIPIKSFDECPRMGALLVGFEVALGTHFQEDGAIYGISPLYRIEGREVAFQEFGLFPGKKIPGRKLGKSHAKRVVTVKALPGYAVGKITLYTGIRVHSMSVTFMKIRGQRLDPRQSYSSDWIGTQQEGQPHSVGGTGDPIVGVFGHCNEEYLMGLGIYQIKPPPLPVKARVQPPRKPPAWPNSLPAEEQPTQPNSLPAEEPPAQENNEQEPVDQNNAEVQTWVEEAVAEEQKEATNDLTILPLLMFAGVTLPAFFVLFLCFGRKKQQL